MTARVAMVTTRVVVEIVTYLLLGLVLVAEPRVQYHLPRPESLLFSQFISYELIFIRYIAILQSAVKRVL